MAKISLQKQDRGLMIKGGRMKRRGTDIRTTWERSGRTRGGLHHELRGHIISTSSPVWPRYDGAQQTARDRRMNEGMDGRMKKCYIAGTGKEIKCRNEGISSQTLVK